MAWESPENINTIQLMFQPSEIICEPQLSQDKEGRLRIISQCPANCSNMSVIFYVVFPAWMKQ